MARIVLVPAPALAVGLDVLNVVSEAIAGCDCNTRNVSLASVYAKTEKSPDPVISAPDTFVLASVIGYSIQLFCLGSCLLLKRYGCKRGAINVPWLEIPKKRAPNSVLMAGSSSSIASCASVVPSTSARDEPFKKL